ncbi:apolipoprotein A-V isoform X1 [Callithrix jacchus]|uniref:Apolipoprotein A-V n=1 Tax=Callithrix jacchus TaxID=9483 RepID=B0KWQ9_CALJA|nr:apolipoprotein A-V isoform X2 [Callithrix jacchus]XP_035120531.1 apolipoprotein A-V isoform X2 [Callithrix jacchus]XP_054097601.1 apolipoprotein A-V isoform X2 [Callithrix jacchus]ABZ10533.1 apolipoprotein AV (predicted) [Callithrix jacchus]
MASMAAMLTWALALLSVFSATQARKGFWDYFRQTSGEKGRMEQIHQQKMAREPASLKDSLEQDLNNMNKFLEKLGPLSESEASRLPRDPVGMRQQLQEELEEVRARLQPYMAEAHELVGWNLEGLRQQLKPYTMNLMEQVALHMQELQEKLRVVGEDTKAQLLGGVGEARALLQELQSSVVHHTGRFKELFHPYAESLVSGIGRHVQELHRSVAPHAPASPARLSRCVQVLSRKLTLKAKALHAGIQQNLDQLREELSRAFAGTGVEQGAGPDPQMLSEEVRQRLQAFRQDTYLQIAAFTRAIDQETEEVQQQLAPPPPGHSAFAPEFGQMDSDKALSKLQARLDDLWEDITYSLHDQGHSHLGEP